MMAFYRDIVSKVPGTVQIIVINGSSLWETLSLDVCAG